MLNRLAQNLSRWRWWYAVPGMVALVVASLATVAGAILGEGPTVGAAMVVVQFLLLAAIPLILIGLFSRRVPSAHDLALKPGLSRRDMLVIVVTFIVTHVIFWLLSLVPGQDTTGAGTYFQESGFGGPLLPAVLGLISTAILAPVCEEIVYRGTVLRPLHDALARRGRPGWGAALGIVVSTVVFALPHLDQLTGVNAVAYLLTGVAFGAVYVITGSLTAVMVSHALQSCWATMNILVFGHGDASVHPLLHVLGIGSPFIVFLIARVLYTALPKGEEPTRTASAK